MGGRRCRGFSLLELALVLLVGGVILFMFSGFAANALESGGSKLMGERLQGMSGKILAFAQRHYRLPCPDTTGDGNENCAAGSSLRGAVPYKTLALDQPFMGRKGSQVIYAIAADLGQTHNVDTPSWRMDVVDRRDMCDFMSGRLKRAPTTADLAVVDAGAAACANASVTNPAFLLVDSGSADLDGVNGLFDGFNGQTGNNCYHAPAMPRSGSYDDSVQVFGMAGLIGSLCQ